MFNSIDENGSVDNHGIFDLNFDDLQLRYGKTIEELHLEYEAIVNSYKSGRKSILGSTQEGAKLIESKVTNLLNTWKYCVYDEICRKSGEIKNLISYNTSGKIFRVIHEIDGWKEIELLKNFCTQSKLLIDKTFFNSLSTKLNAIGSLTVQVWIEFNTTGSELAVMIGFNLVKPSDKELVESFLEHSVERNNVITWFDANTPVPIEYGFGIGENANEMLIGFYFFDGSLNINLGRSLTAFQAYGANLSKEFVEVLKGFSSEEYKVHFMISPEGVQKVRMLINKISDNAKAKMIEHITGRGGQQEWDELNKAFASLKIKDMYFLEYTNEGFGIHTIIEVGGEITSRVYIDGGY